MIDLSVQRISVIDELGCKMLRKSIYETTVDDAMSFLLLYGNVCNL